MTLIYTGLGSADPVGIQQLRRTYKYFKDYRQVCGDPFGGGSPILGGGFMASGVAISILRAFSFSWGASSPFWGHVGSPSPLGGPCPSAGKSRPCFGVLCPHSGSHLPLFWGLLSPIWAPCPHWGGPCPHFGVFVARQGLPSSVWGGGGKLSPFAGALHPHAPALAPMPVQGPCPFLGTIVPVPVAHPHAGGGTPSLPVTRPR